ncbi:hypothetical protein [Mycolicibacterium arenosum]|uniref:PPE family protein n=1 Tax=Mycolicibacterium arenosum TaxID=2952157 RepID=A0ABT1LY84_9MYCO|nr:hypothetical protein [Mycolicibacterium sp. CAU 1645]MCP9271550.1 hypothetical protein [Mycolicibacterium sp. CAU 1645]
MCTPPAGSQPIFDDVKDLDPDHWPENRRNAEIQARNPHTRLPELDGRDYAKDPSTVVVEDFNGLSYGQAWLNISGADPDVAPNHTGQWQEISSAIVSAVQDFRLDLSALEGKEDRWAGVTHDAALANLESSFVEPQAAGSGAGAMSVVVDAFSRTISATRENIVNNRKNYLVDVADFPEHRDQIERKYATFAQKVMKEAYAPNIVDIAKNHPAFTTGAKIGVGPMPVGPTGTASQAGGPAPQLGGGVGGVGGVGSFGGGGVGGFGGPSLGSALAGLGPRPDLAELPKGPMSPSVPGAPAGSGGAPGALANAAKDALGQAANAAKQAAGSAAKTPPMSARPPEGVLGLGPKGVGGLPERAGGTGGAGVGAGAGPRDLAAPKGTGTPSTAAGRLAGIANGLGQAGMAGAGAPGTGAPPPSGQRGGPEEKDHKVNKALRTKRNGESLFGEAAAIVPVVGDAGDPAAGKPEAS